MKENALMKKVGCTHVLLFLSLNAMSLMFSFRYGTLMILIHIMMSVIVSGWLIFKRRIFDEIILDVVKSANPYIYIYIYIRIAGFCN